MPFLPLRAVLRLVLLRLTAQRTVLQPSIPEREIDPSVLAQAEAKKSSVSSESETWKGARTGFELPTIASLRAQAGDGVTRVENEISAFLQKKVLTIDGVRKPYDLVRKRKGLGVIAEVVWILRPLIYGKRRLRFCAGVLAHSIIGSPRAQEVRQEASISVPSVVGPGVLCLSEYG